ncbi:MAG: hypothetical protein ABJA87_00790 [bacterium]
MNEYIKKAARRVAPRTVNNIRTLATLDQQFEQGPARFISYERELRELRREIDELRRDNRRVAELYDAVFEWAHQQIPNAPERPDAEHATTADHVTAQHATTADRVAAELAEHR